jgi:hypothetical protein
VQRRVARQVALGPVAHRLERGMGERAVEMRPHPGQVAEVGRLAVAPGEPHEEAEDLEVALRREDRCRKVEASGSAPVRARYRARISAASGGGTSRRASPSSETTS